MSALRLVSRSTTSRAALRVHALLSFTPSLVATAATSSVAVMPPVSRSIASLSRTTTLPAFSGVRAFSVPTNTAMFCRQVRICERLCGSGLRSARDATTQKIKLKFFVFHFSHTVRANRKWHWMFDYRNLRQDARSGRTPRIDCRDVQEW